MRLPGPDRLFQAKFTRDNIKLILRMITVTSLQIQFFRINQTMTLFIDSNSILQMWDMEAYDPLKFNLEFCICRTIKTHNRSPNRVHIIRVVRNSANLIYKTRI